ncbi:MAG: sigma-70 family RNA polymerase sigma factor [Clostridia bacterium]|nr:sigma-70 family RNA polymerase sigma factor [Clostridia bacterium]
MIDVINANRIAEAYYDDVRAFCYSKVKDIQVAENLTQDTFLTFQLKVDNLKDEHIIAWLINTASNLIKQYLRESKRFVQEELNESHLSVDDIMECIERENPVLPEVIEERKSKVLSALNEKETELFTKRYVEHKSYKEIANELNISENAATVYCCRLRTKIISEAKFITSAWVLLVAKIFFENF